MDINTVASAAHSRPPLPVVAGGASGSTDDSKSAMPVAPFLSPVYRFDPLARLSVLVFRDAATGDVTQQFPSKKVVEQYRRTRGEPLDGKSSQHPATETNGAGNEPANDHSKLAGDGAPAATGSGGAQKVATAVSGGAGVTATGGSGATGASAGGGGSASVQRVSLSV